MPEQYILAIAEGTSYTRVLIVDHRSNIKAHLYTESTQYNPAADRVQLNPGDKWETIRGLIKQTFAKAELKGSDIAAIGIANQRSTTVVWDRSTGKPITPAISWQDTRAADFVENIRLQWADKVYRRTGWTLSLIHSSLNLRWILENIPDARTRAEAGELAFGTIDSWLIYNLTGGKVHAISASNASATGAYDLINDCWYSQWLDFLNIPLELFPEICDDSGIFGVTDPDILGVEIPITGAIANIQAALFGQGCAEPGMVKCTHSNGTFLNMNTGSKMTISKNGLNTIIAWRRNGETIYGLEGFAAVTGSAVQWLQDGARIIDSPAQSESLATSVSDNGGIYFVPALSGLSAPYWDSHARGMIIGINRDTSLAHLVRATLEGIVYATKYFLETMRNDSGIDITSIKVDGSASRNNFILQFQANMLGVEVVRPVDHKAEGLGAAYMAGLAVGYWDSPDTCFANAKIDRIFKPQISDEERNRLYAEWNKAVKRCMGWIE
ncbi:MAG: glycerol kinase GlpK [Deltaproteobacteria bacterium]|nr:glycerol kinase GlpK [Deltaproteobacteria bacterium]